MIAPDNEVAQLNELHEVFVPFETEYIEGCEVIYLNEALCERQNSTDLLASYSYIIRTDTVPRRANATRKTFMAERYGGDGILSNGGGARCGFDGVWQLKGLGANPLVGHDVDAGHGDGNLSLTTALYESVWAEIIASVLPFGATRTVAILDTGLTYETWRGTLKRGLLVRQPVVRPAHFIRSIYFRQQRLNCLGEDALRVKQVIQRLVDFLPGVQASTALMPSLEQRLENGLVELAGRYAEQFAAARAKHIIHYNVSASNVSLTGGWLDLSGICLFTHFINGDRSSIDRFNSEYLPALQSLQSLCYYLGKYAVVDNEVSLHLWQKTLEHFNQRYSHYLNLYQVAQAGFPLWLLRRLENAPEFNAFATALQRFLALDDFTVTAIADTTGWDGYQRWTGRLFHALLSRNGKDGDLAWLGSDATLTDPLCSSYDLLFTRIAQAAGEYNIDRHNLQLTLLINATRLNRSHRVLHELQSLIEAIDTEPVGDRRAALHALQDHALLAGRFNLGHEQPDALPFWSSATLAIYFNPQTGRFTLSERDTTPLTLEALSAKAEGHEEIRQALNFYPGLVR
ncbi:hypothetical protein N5E96_22995 [Pseudomonas mosselii]|uniref:hypothetical protein n=1 Tax=Pseudomonas mosselii TaxID=78327 RepID=UPI00076FEAF8|nr:hypothetical protein [Pseudomonas mosselii]AMK32159.1 MchC protein [Pseudomonas putida]MBC3452993.1 hypothetical protein [Pseudomonas mosselii]MDH1658576.1 hypothetical protein [Pseudomonas mosselii]MDH1719123.1 hypothetical protein [Pseudomonas mosselii]MDH1724156.1 hypothetical protein [Pseudomonas mosselii]